MFHKTVASKRTSLPLRYRFLQTRFLRFSAKLLVVGALLAVPFAARGDFDTSNLSNLADLDAFVLAKFTAISNDACIYPEGPFQIGINCGFLAFADGSDLAALTNAMISSSTLGVPLYRMTVFETQGTTRAWLYIGTNGVAFRTNNTPASFDAQAWVRVAYRHDPPSYLSGTNLALWYADRDRSRLFLMMTLVNSNNWPTFQANMQAAVTNATSSDTLPPSPPADSNRLSFVNIRSSDNNTITLWLYTPSNRPVAILTRPTLSGGSNTWSLAGTTRSPAPFQSWQTLGNMTSAFFFAGYSDQDSDGDGIPDFLEIYVFGTNPYSADSDGDGISDYDEIFVYGTDPNNPDTTKPSVTLSSPVNNYSLVWQP